MAVTSVERYILFALGEFCTQANKKLSDRPLQLSVSKAEFIAIATKTQMTAKKERAIYKNLESLQEKKCISYDDKNLELTSKGQKELFKVNAELLPYLNLKEFLKTENALKYARKAQTVFSDRTEY